MGARILVIDNYDSFVYNLVQYLGELGAEPVVHRHDAIDLHEVAAIDPDGILIGNGSDDILDGRAGNDKLIGGAGDDWLTGGSGKDQFVFDSAGRDGEGDVITDFTRGQDKLVISKASYGIASADKTVTLVVGADPVSTSSKGTFLFESDNGRLWFDADGKGADADLELVATLNGIKTLSVDDFSFL